MKITNKLLLKELELSKRSNGMTQSLCTMLLAMIDKYIEKKETVDWKGTKLSSTVRINLINTIDKHYRTFDSKKSTNPYAYFYAILNKELIRLSK